MAEVKKKQRPSRATQYGRMCQLIKFLATGPKTTDQITDFLVMRKSSTSYATIRRMLNALDAEGMAQAVGYKRQPGRGLNPTLYGLTKWAMKELPVNELRCVRWEDEGDRNAGAAGRLVCANALLPDVSEIVPDQGDHRRA